MKQLGINTNIQLSKQDIQQQWVVQAEVSYHQAIQAVVFEILEQDSKVIFLAGPSASGKTTTAHQICDALKQKGKAAMYLSLDNFYKPHRDIPLQDDGDLDLESIVALDLDAIHQTLLGLQSKKAVSYPVYDFQTGDYSGEKIHIPANPDWITIVEGIHALNPQIHGCCELGTTLKIYVSVATSFNLINSKETLTSDELRILRRIVRDYYHRGAQVSKTLAMWSDVLDGEQAFIKPYADGADVRINTTHVYEPYVYGQLLDGIQEEKALIASLRAYQKLATLKPLPIAWIPDSSLIQEFLPLKGK
ncbi:MAG: uridine kinase family protein [Erysipelotrichaceae bacterium]